MSIRVAYSLNDLQRVAHAVLLTRDLLVSYLGIVDLTFIANIDAGSHNINNRHFVMIQSVTVSMAPFCIWTSYINVMRVQ